MIDHGANRTNCASDHTKDGVGITPERADFFLSPAFCLAQRAFCAAEIFARAAADIFRRLRPEPFGRPGPR